jgi:hypothetical protein
MVKSFNVGVGLLVAVFVSGPLIVPACVLEIMASGRLHAGNSEIQDRVVPEGPRYHLRASVNREQNGAGTIKPMPRRDKSTTESTEWTTIFAENFESGFPGSSWDVWSPEGSSTAVWDVWTCWSGDSPNKSAGCAAGGSAAIGCDGLYPNNMDAWIVYGPFSLAYPGITAAEFSFNFTLESEENQDFFYAAASTDGDVFDYVQSSGSVAPSSYTVDLTDAFDMGNLLGQDQVWIAFLFQSDRSVAEGVGAQVDDVLIRAQYASIEAPGLQISALKNPGRTRSLKLLVKVSGGSGNAPTVTVGETSIEMSALGNSIYLGQYFAAANEGSVTITATDTNVHGTGSEQVTVQF